MSTLMHAGLQFGAVVQLESIGHSRYRVQLLGLLPEVTLMVTAPEAAGHVVPLAVGDSFIVRIFTGDEAVAFRAAVTRVCRQPFAYLHLTYPATVEKALVRNARRARLNLAAQAQGKAGEPAAVSIDDLSIEGAQLESPVELGEIGTRISLSATLPLDRIGERSVTLSAELKNHKSHQGEDGAQAHRYGVRFVDLEAESDLVLTAYVYKQLNAQLLKEA